MVTKKIPVLVSQIIVVTIAFYTAISMLSISILKDTMPIIGIIYNLSTVVFYFVTLLTLSIFYLNRRNLLLIYLLTVFLIINMFLSKNIFVMDIYVVSLATYLVGSNKAIKTMFYAQLITLVIIISLALIGFLPNQISMRMSDGVIRYSLGFINPNDVAHYCYAVIFKWLFIFWDRVKIYQLAVISILMLFIFNMTDSRATEYIFYASIVAIISGLIFRKTTYQLSRRFSRRYLLLLLIVLPTVTLILVSFYNPFSMQWFELDRLFSTRISQSNNFLNQYGISIIGQKLLLIGSSRAYLLGLKPLVLDSGYMSLWIKSGIIVLLLFIYSNFWSLKNYKKKNVYPLLVLVVTLLFEGIMNSSMISWQINFAMLFIGSRIVKGVSKEENVI